jgi:acid phosphatase
MVILSTRLRVVVVLLLTSCPYLYLAAAIPDVHDRDTTTPIKHLIVIVGENHSFDNVFGAYQPGTGHRVANLLSKGIINADGTPGPAFALAAQQQAVELKHYSTAPAQLVPYPYLPAPVFKQQVDQRYPANLPNGPFQLTNAAAPYDSYFGDPLHRFFQMWQMTDHGRNDLFPWVAITSMTRSKVSSQPSFAHGFGGEAMGFFNMNSGDAPIFKQLADQYAMSDNYHQFTMGGSGADFIALVTGDVAKYEFMDASGRTYTVPPPAQIEDPDALRPYNNYYTDDGPGIGSYVNCSDRSQPGVRSIRDYLATQTVFRNGNCDKGIYYLINNSTLAYNTTGTQRPFDPQTLPPKAVLPPQTIPTIADALTVKQISWKYYSGGRNFDNTTTNQYCAICDPLTGFTSIMTTSLRNRLQGLRAFRRDLATERALPAVSFVRPYNRSSGHPGSTKLADFESFIMKIIQRVQASSTLWNSTAIVITFDEGGGYYDSGYIQAMDFFGDGTRVPVLIVSPWVKHAYIDHEYADHASILKFIERNWGLGPLSDRSRDNLPNPQFNSANPYVPPNMPAISDLFSLFNFK